MTRSERDKNKDRGKTNDLKELTEGPKKNNIQDKKKAHCLSI